ncbi:hypothetical protein [Actinoplanes sp. NPDC051494]|uniref:hypothetical protein n=1 Tax=Actinoplanes sp. NPDC051494 TaxID=3363907 RepID=UPI0037B63B36
MRLAEIQVGSEYAHRVRLPNREPSPPTRVLVREKLAAGRLRVEVVGTGALIEVGSQNIVSPWDVPASAQARPLPPAYDRGHDSWPVGSMDDLRGWPDAALRLLKGMPVGLAHDLLAVTEHTSEELPQGSVGAVLGPVASTLDAALRWAAGDGRLAARLSDELWESTADFAAACADSFEIHGDRLDLPDTPVLTPTVFAGPGWLRVSYGETSGRRLHAPNCRVLQSLALAPDEAPTWPVWRLNLPGTDLCGICGGPGILATPAVLGFVAAALIWRHRPEKPIERWQLRACLTVLAEAAAARAREVEPDSYWYERVVTELLADPPSGPDTLFHPSFEKWAKRRQIAALTQAADRLTFLAGILPSRLRPEPPTRLTDRGQVQEWYKALTEVCHDEIPHVELLLFPE